jgi:hypothetical protein
MNEALERIGTLADEIRAGFEGVRVELQTFESGAAMLDVWWRGRFWVLQFTPRDGYVLDDRVEEHPFNTGCALATPEFATAREQLIESLTRAGTNSMRDSRDG